ncbi:MAG: serine/threonine-protein kinase [Anaerolineales bacterium]|nr:serine/threonine-protein kinase [Anaerolineales bacterium]
MYKFCAQKEARLESTKNITDPLKEDEGGESKRLQILPKTALVNRYVIQDVIGVGGMGSVYRARDLHFPNVVKLVAVKEMINNASDPLIRQTIIHNFEREANILATLNHSSIPRIYDYFSLEERSYLVLEFINGKDLEMTIEETEGFMAEEQVLVWAIELCDVLNFLHTHKPDPIIFRDMKPSNVMINQSQHVMLVDFGIAKPFQAGQKGTMIGTEGYSPPEQYRGESTPLADVYALGATLHHALTRRNPQMEPPFSFSERPVRKINPAISADLETVISRALQYNPEDRFQSAEEMKEALVAAGRKTGILNRIGGMTAAIQSGGLKPLWTFQCEDEIRSTPIHYDGSIYIGSYDHNLYCLNAVTGEFQWKYATDNGIVTRPAVYESNIYFGSEDQRLHVVSARSGKVVWTYYTEGAVRSSPRIAEGHIFFGSDDAHIHAVNVLTGRAAWRFETAAPVRSTPFVTNEAVFSGCESGDFYCVDFGGELKWRFKAKLAVTSSPWVEEGVVYFGSLYSSFYALDTRSGWAIWRFRMGKGSIVSPCLAEGLIFTGSADGHIYAIDARTSREAWRFRTEHQVSGSPVIYKDSLYCGTADGYLFCLEYRTGRLRWKFSSQGPITGAPLVDNDIVYVGSADHFLYALLA